MWDLAIQTNKIDHVLCLRTIKEKMLIVDVAASTDNEISFKNNKI